jgi:hypothetical protein
LRLCDKVVGAALEHILEQHSDEIVLPIDISECLIFRELFPDLDASNLDGAYYDVEALSLGFIKFVVEAPSLQKHLTWIVDGDGALGLSPRF